MSDVQSSLRVILFRTKAALEKFQDMLNFDGWEGHFHYKDRMGIGRSGLIGSVLGVIGGFHLCLFLFMLLFAPNGLIRSALVVWSLYIVFLVTFHFLEFFVTSVRQPHSLSTDSFIVNHSLNYTIAILASCLEFWLETLIFGRNRFRYRITFLLGILLVVGGQYFRSLAMWQCGESFNHIIAQDKPAHHRLQTQGLYHYLRHPSYFGWFYWTLGMQLVLGNFWCLLAYAYVSWTFFRDRIPYEEHLLWQFYGEEYQAYVARTYIGIPLIFSKIPSLQKQGKTTTTMDPHASNNASTVDSASPKDKTVPISLDEPSVHRNDSSGDDVNTAEKSPLSVMEEDDEDYDSVKMAANSTTIIAPVVHLETNNNTDDAQHNAPQDTHEASLDEAENDANFPKDKKND